jgi:hypothetical protein
MQVSKGPLSQDPSELTEEFPHGSRTNRLVAYGKHVDVVLGGDDPAAFANGLTY